MKISLCSIIMVLFLVNRVNVVLAQEAESIGDKHNDKTEIIQDPRVDLLIKKHIQVNQALNTMDGFRIQLFSDSGTNSKNKAMGVQDEFQAKFPDIGVYLSFKSPNYKVRIGDFRTKLDAQRFLVEIAADYPNAFIIADQINLPKPE